jgi:hypothetical protein
VHYANAYFYETQGLRFRSHRAREAALARDWTAQPGMRSAFTAYMRLRDLAHRLRYQPNFHVKQPVVDDALHNRLATVVQAVCTALNIPPPP